MFRKRVANSACVPFRRLESNALALPVSLAVERQLPFEREQGTALVFVHSEVIISMEVIANRITLEPAGDATVTCSDIY